MRIGTNHHFPRTDKTFFWQNNVLDTHATDFKIVCNAMFAYKIAHDFSLCSRLNIFIWCEMVRHQVNFMAVKYRFFNLFKFTKRWWECGIIHQHSIQVTLNDLAWFYHIKTCVASHVLFSNGHTHNIILPPVVLAP